MGSQALRVKLLGQPRMDPPNKKLGKASEVWWFSRQQLWVLHQTKPTGVNCQVWLKNDDYLSTKHGKIHQQTCLRIESTSRVKTTCFNADEGPIGIQFVMKTQTLSLKNGFRQKQWILLCKLYPRIKRFDDFIWVDWMGLRDSWKMEVKTGKIFVT
jgi:hypothetical protein